MTAMKRTFLQRVGPIRVRTTAAAVLVVGATLLVAAIAMVVLFERSLTRGSLVSARIQALAVVRELRSDDVRPADLILGAPEEDEQFVQILRQDGTVVAASPNVTGREAVVRLGDGESLSLPPLSPPDIEPFDDPFIVTALVMRDQGLKVLVGKNLEPVQVASAHLQGILARAMPLQLLVVGIVTWLVVGRALQPVEAIRADVDAISARDLHRRVPDPPGDDEISRLVATMNRMLERLEDARLRERRFVSDASHELRSPVAAIRQYAEVARVHPDRTSLEELAEVVLEEDARLQHLVEDLLFLTRLDEGTLVRPSTPVDLDDLVLEEASRLRTATHLRVDSTGVSPGRVVGDRDQLERLVRNLTENAARHATGQVRVSLGELDGRVVLRVDDDGSGVDPRHRERIFDRFVRLDEARDRDSGGSGLGLAIVREVAEFHGGDVRVLESDLGGSRFEIRLPATA
jgi:signal transduction histidine kinase